MNDRFKKGFYTPINRSKYKGKVLPIYRSNWEYKYMRYLDMEESVIEWVSEPYPIYYFNPVKQKQTRYYPDFLVKYKNKNGDEYLELVEIKPYKQTIPPVNTGKKQKRTLMIESYNWMVNVAKWKSAIAYCKQRNIIFKILTERELKIR
jgi:hypothetical protein